MKKKHHCKSLYAWKECLSRAAHAAVETGENMLEHSNTQMCFAHHLP